MFDTAALGALLMRLFTPWLLRQVGYRRGLIGNGVLASRGYAVCAFFRPGWPDWLMLSVGVCVGALVLKVAIAFGNDPRPQLSDFSVAFIVVTLISASSTWWHLQFAKDVGAELSGHRAKAA